MIMKFHHFWFWHALAQISELFSTLIVLCLVSRQNTERFDSAGSMNLGQDGISTYWEAHEILVLIAMASIKRFM